MPVTKKISTKKFMSNLKRFANKFYLNVDSSKIIIGGDGAPWIRESTKYWPDSKYILDKFHAIRYLKQIFPKRNNQLDFQSYMKVKKLFELGAFDDFIDSLSQINKNDDLKNKKISKIISFFSNNSFGILNQKLEWNIGVSAEGDISHIVKWLLGYGSKAFSYQTFTNMLLLKVNEVNKIDVISFLKTSINNSFKN